MKKQVVIIGSGPAGLTAAIYTSRALLETTIIGGREFGGQLMSTTEVENFPGFPEGIQGPELMKRMADQAERFKSEIIRENAISIKPNASEFVVTTESGSVTADSVILAMGASHRKLAVPGEDRLSGHGVSYCATCDGFFFRGKDIAVIGGGDSAMEEATFLTKFASKVYVIHRREEFRASKIMVEKAKANPKIEFILNTTVKEVVGESNVESLSLTDVVTHEERSLPVSGVFVAVGLVPNSSIVDGLISIDPKGYIETVNHVQTSIPGLFVAGDVHDHHYRQAITAAGFGCAAALEAERYLAHKQHMDSAKESA